MGPICCKPLVRVMTLRLFVRVVLAFAVLLAAGGCQGTSDPGAQDSTGNDADRTEVIIVDGPHYQATEDVAYAADEIFVGRITAVEQGMESPSYDGEDPSANPLADTNRTASSEELERGEVPVTSYSVEVGQVVAGEVDASGPVLVHQLGAGVEGTTYRVEGVVPLQVSDDRVLFFTTSGGAEGHYLIGGSVGQFAERSPGTFVSMAEGRSDLAVVEQEFPQLRRAWEDPSYRGVGGRDIEG